MMILSAHDQLAYVHVSLFIEADESREHHEQGALGAGNHFCGGDSFLLTAADAPDHLAAHLHSTTMHLHVHRLKIAVHAGYHNFRAA